MHFGNPVEKSKKLIMLSKLMKTVVFQLLFQDLFQTVFQWQIEGYMFMSSYECHWIWGIMIHFKLYFWCYFQWGTEWGLCILWRNYCKAMKEPSGAINTGWIQGEEKEWKAFHQESLMCEPSVENTSERRGEERKGRGFQRLWSGKAGAEKVLCL